VPDSDAIRDLIASAQGGLADAVSLTTKAKRRDLIAAAQVQADCARAGRHPEPRRRDPSVGEPRGDTVKKLSPYAKAAAGFLAAALVALLGAQDGGITAGEWVQIVIAGLGGSGLVYMVPNRDPKALHQQESVQPPNVGEGKRAAGGQHGQTTLLYILAVVVLVLLLIWLLTGLPYVGSSIQSNGDPASLETFCGRVLGVRRNYYNVSASIDLLDHDGEGERG
jgi:hypothetical protein